MAWESKIAAAFDMTDEVWERHANPWSVWTRAATLPIFALAVWSRVWIGGWSFGLVAIVIVWVWLNPRLFARPLTTRSWASRAVLGERVWLNRAAVPVPERYLHGPRICNSIGVTGLLVFLYGLVVLHLTSTVLGMILIYIGKMTFLHLMVRLYDEMRDATPEYQAWYY